MLIMRNNLEIIFKIMFKNNDLPNVNYYKT